MAIARSGLAEGEGFEPPEALPPQRFSRPPQSTTLPSLLNLRIDPSLWEPLVRRCLAEAVKAGRAR